MKSDKEHRLSKNQRRKARRYGKKPTNSSAPENREFHDSSQSSAQFIRSLLIRREKDHALDELDPNKLKFERKHNSVVPGSYETGKRQ